MKKTEKKQQNIILDDSQLFHLEAMVPPLLHWHRDNRRILPWREDRDPYRIWISEVMLQQTRIEAAIPYYQRFLAAFPDVEALAEAEDEVLMKLWQGLGYYSRARNLKKAAVQIMEEYGGVFPEEAEALRKLSGIGDYTAGAISSLAFGRPSPAVDGNVLRVLMRYLACGDDVMLPATKKEVTAYLAAIYPTGEDAAMLTEALMELGQRICLPSGAPSCAGCPLKLLCRGYGEDQPERYPTRSGKKERRVEEKTMLLLRCGTRYALCRRPEKGLLAGLWGLPELAGKQDAAAVTEALEKQGHEVTDIRALGDAKHIFTHIEWHMTGYLVTVAKELQGYTWESAEEIGGLYAVPTAFRYYMQQME